jgi:hypothetical protein
VFFYLDQLTKAPNYPIVASLIHMFFWPIQAQTSGKNYDRTEEIMLVELDVKNLSGIKDRTTPSVHVRLAKAIERAMSDLSEIRQANIIQLTVCPGRECAIAFDYNGEYAGFVMQITLRNSANQQFPIPAAETNTLYIAAYPQFGDPAITTIFNGNLRYFNGPWEEVIPRLAREVLTLLAISHA